MTEDLLFTASIQQIWKSPETMKDDQFAQIWILTAATLPKHDRGWTF